MDVDAKRAIKSSSKLVSGAAILASAAIISKLLGTLQKIPLQNIGGDEVFGVYNAVYPFYSLILFAATAGLPITVSKFVAEYIALGDERQAQRVLNVATGLLAATGVAFFILMYFGAPWIAQAIGHAETELALKSIALALVFVPPMAAMRGYYQGRQNMWPTAISQVVEQTVRVITMVALLIYFTSLSMAVEWVAAGATFGTVTGAFAGLFVMLLFFMHDRRNRRRSLAGAGQPERLSALVRKMLLFAIPVSLGAIVVPLLSIVDTFTMPRMLQQAGFGASQAMHQFGIYARGLPLVQLVALLFSAMSVALVPSLAEARLKRANRAIAERAEFALRLTWLIGWAASLGIALLASSLNRMLFMNDEGSLSMAILAFTAIFSCMNIVTASMLQGLGAAVAPAVSLLIAAIVKIALNIWWVPQWGIEGAASAAVITFAIASLLNWRALAKRVNMRLSLQVYLFKPLLALIVMGIALMIWLRGGAWLSSLLSWDLHARSVATAISLSAVLCGALVFLLTVLRLGIIRVDELRQLPKFGPKLVTFLIKMRLVRRQRHE